MRVIKKHFNKSLSFVKELVIRCIFVNLRVVGGGNPRFFADKCCFFFVISQIMSYFASFYDYN